MLTKRDLLRSTAAIAALAATTAKYTPAIAQNKADWPRLLEAKDIAEEGFIYGLPLVMNYAVMQEFAVDRNSGQFKAPFNEIKNLHHVATPADTAVITPNSDTPYSMTWLDLRAEPMVISVPMIEKDRYYAVQLIDGNTYNFGYIGTRATGTEPGDYLVVGPDWKGGMPSGIKKVFQSTTPFTFALIRTQLFNPGDISNVEKVQTGYKVQPLSAFLKQPPPPAAPKIDFVPATTAGIKDNFFEYLDAALQFVPETPRDKAIRAKLAKIGIGPGKTFKFKELSLEHKAEILVGMKQGDDKVDKWLAGGNKSINGWNVGSFFGDEAFYNGDWLMRAGAAKGGLYGNDAVEAMYPYTRTDATGDAARRQQAQVHHHLRTRPVAASECVLVRYDVRRQEPAPGQEPDQSLPHQLSDVVGDEKGRRRLADAVHPERQPRRGQGSKLASGAGRQDLSRDAPVLAEAYATFDPAAGRRDMAAARHQAGLTAPGPIMLRGKLL